jgi:hypothetical protein
MAKHTVESLHALGFDASAQEGFLKVQCSECEAMVINGVPTHEHTCPNAMKECEGCNNIIPACGRFCIECID